jgi:demethylmenaquinone methyltransferase / 2-methoxy-6-polyprenyl-1,4-benzoquinol methylase
LVSSEESGFGLKEDWASVQKTLEEIIPVYDKTNRYISLGTDLKLRKKGIDLLLKYSGEGGSTLDLGCGTGKMSIQFASQDQKRKSSVVLLDPINSMARLAKSKTGLEAIIAVFENLPFKQKAFESAMAGFAIRDARVLSRAFNEIHGVLATNGKFLVVDLSKPDSKIKSALIRTYWRAFAPLIAFVSSGRLGLKFGALAKTYGKLPKSSEFIKLAGRSGFQVSVAEYSMLGGACAILFSKKDKDDTP